MKKSVKPALTGILIAIMCIAAGVFAYRFWTQRESRYEEMTEDRPSGSESVRLEVVTTFAANDGNALNYKNGYHEWERLTGNTVYDKSVLSDNSFKMRVLTDFETDSEPDVLFFFVGVDANPFIEAGKVVSIDEIRSVYPEYADNMILDQIPVSPVDGKTYAVPVNGYWEALFVNRDILKAAGVDMPGADYTWGRFIADCQKIKDAGYTPIAASLGNIPHYWWEVCVFNHTSPQSHLTIPGGAGSEAGQAWTAGLEDLRFLYQAGFFPWNTLSATDDETFKMFMNGKAAFLVDGSWKLGGIVSACQTDPDDEATLDEAKLGKFDITFAPAKGERVASDLIGGMSMGYYITRKAWNNPVKREAAVSFITHMTSDEMVTQFSRYTSNVLKNDDQPAADEEVGNSLEKKARRMIENSTSLTGAVQDIIKEEGKTAIFEGLTGVLNGSRTSEELVEESLRVYIW